MFRSNVFPVKSGFSRAGKKKKWWTDRWRDDASTILNRDTLLCLYAFTRRVPLQGIQKNLAISRQFATTRDNVQFFISPLKKQRNDTQIFPEKTLPLFLPHARRSFPTKKIFPLRRSLERRRNADCETPSSNNIHARVLRTRVYIHTRQ